MTTNRPPEIGRRHLERLAVVYTRQSTLRQVQENIGSTASQRNQTQIAARWGWPASAIRELEDLGESGRTADRPAYQELLKLITNDQVGAVFITNFQRSGREAVESLSMLRLCATFEVIVVVDGRPYDMGDSSNLLLARIQAVCAEYENSLRTETMQRARRAKATLGKAVAGPPLGYVRLPDGSWAFHPDPRVQEAIREAFAEYLRCRSLRTTIQALEARGIRYPRVLRNGAIRFSRWRTTTLAFTLDHEAYTGDYHFPRTQAVRDPRTGKTSRQPTPLEQRVVTEGHHPAYVSREVFEEARKIRAGNRASSPRTPAGPGSQALQGLLHCATHPGPSGRRLMKPHSGKNGKWRDQAPYYYCDADYELGGTKCSFLPGRQLDEAVRDAVLARLEPVGIEALTRELADVEQHERSHRRRLERELFQARERIEDLKELILSVASRATPLVALEYERELEKALGRSRELEATLAELSRGGSPPASEEELRELRRLGSDVAALYAHPATTNRDRKEFLRSMVDHVVYDETRKDRVLLRVVWADGAPQTPIVAYLPAYAHTLIDEMYEQGLMPKEIARRLEEMGVRTALGTKRPPASIASRRHLSLKVKR